MAQYGYTYRTASISKSYNTSSVRNETTGGPLTKPFAPYVPKFNTDNGYSEEYVTKKKIIPVTSSKPYDEESDDEWKHQRQPSPVRGSPRKFDKASLSPPRPGLVTSPDYWRPSSHPKPYNGYAGYGTNKPKHDGYNNGSNYGNKPFGGNVKNYDNHDGYGDYGARKPVAGAINHDGYRSPVKKDNYDHGYGGHEDYNDKEWPRSKPKPTGSPVYDSGYGSDYGNYHNKEGPKPTGSHIYNNGNGGYGSGGASPTRRDNYDHEDEYGNYYNNNKEGYKHGGNGGGPKPTSGWTDSPRKGTQLTTATNNIEEAMQFLKNEVAMRNGNDSKTHQYHDDKTMNLVNETKRLKNIVTGAPQTQSPRPSVPTKDEAKPNGNFNLAPMRQRYNFSDGRRPDYDRRRGYGVMDHKEAEKMFNGVTIDHKEAKKMFNGVTIDHKEAKGMTI